MFSQERVVEEGLKLLNSPFHHKGRSSIGIDCAGVLILSYKKAEIIKNYNDIHEYTPLWWTKTKEEFLLNGLIENDFCIVKDEPQLADIVTFILYKKNVPVNHCGMIVDNNKNFIHAKCGKYKKKNFVSIDNLEPNYIKRFAYLLRYRGFMK